MKKILVLALAMGISQTASAGINTLQNLAQGEFRNFSEDLGSALSSKAVSPAEGLGIVGFDVGVELTQTKLAKSEALWNKVGTGSLSNLYVPKLHVTKGLPLDIDIGGFISAVPTTGITLYGGEAKWAFMPGSTVMPAVAVRGALTKLSGVSQLALNTKSLDVSVSKGLAMLTPYAGIGRVWTTSTPNAGSLTEESFSQSKLFVGANFNLGVMNLAAEYDKTGSAASISGKLGMRF
ncbi:MAG: hypothetical protein PHQ60_05595 [Sideroxydans sp.]|nr:hypothetical protein [Sideroxydans sp.]